MSTAAQIAANLANAQNSTGPRTDAGKAASSLNSLKHGLTAQTVLLPGEDEAAYRTMCQGMFASFDAIHVCEKELVQLLSETQWRLQRCVRLEAAILSENLPDFKALDIMSKHESRLKRQYSTTLKELRSLLDARGRAEASVMQNAVRIRRADKLRGTTTNLQEIGFVFSTRQVDAEILRQDTLSSANKTLNAGGPNSLADLLKMKLAR
jgi:hypothetical protein